MLCILAFIFLGVIMKVDVSSIQIGMQQKDDVYTNQKSALKNDPIESVRAVEALAEASESGKHFGEDSEMPKSPQEAMDDIMKYTRLAEVGLELKVDGESDRVVIKVYDKDTQELIRQIPSQEALELAMRLKKVFEQGVDDQASKATMLNEEV